MLHFRKSAVKFVFAKFTEVCMPWGDAKKTKSRNPLAAFTQFFVLTKYELLQPSAWEI